jgi:uncharacterized phosphosugar-binding protein
MFAKTILAGQMVHVFGSGHSRILVEEMWPRYGSFPGFNPIVELSLTFHNLVVGANGQRQAMFLENVSGFASRILRNFDLMPGDSALVISSGGCNVVPVEMAEEFQKRGVKVAAIISTTHSEASTSRHRDGKKLQDFSDIVLDTGAPVGDAMVKIEGLETPVAPGSTVGGCLLVNAIKAEVADRLTKAGQPPKVVGSPPMTEPSRSITSAANAPAAFCATARHQSELRLAKPRFPDYDEHRAAYADRAWCRASEYYRARRHTGAQQAGDVDLRAAAVAVQGIAEAIDQFKRETRVESGHGVEQAIITIDIETQAVEGVRRVAEDAAWCVEVRDRLPRIVNGAADAQQAEQRVVVVADVELQGAAGQGGLCC